jgi:hypothetical protein
MRLRHGGCILARLVAIFFFFCTVSAQSITPDIAYFLFLNRVRSRCDAPKAQSDVACSAYFKRLQLSSQEGALLLQRALATLVELEQNDLKWRQYVKDVVEKKKPIPDSKKAERLNPNPPLGNYKVMHGIVEFRAGQLWPGAGTYLTTKMQQYYQDHGEHQ